MRLKEVGNGSVLREWNILSNACKVARDEWRWITDSPMKPVAKPQKPPARKRIASPEENAKMEQCAGYSKSVPLTTATLRMFAGTCSRLRRRCAQVSYAHWNELKFLKRRGI